MRASIQDTAAKIQQAAASSKETPLPAVEVGCEEDSDCSDRSLGHELHASRNPLPLAQKKKTVEIRLRPKAAKAKSKKRKNSGCEGNRKARVAKTTVADTPAAEASSIAPPILQPSDRPEGEHPAVDAADAGLLPEPPVAAKNEHRA